MAMDHTHLLSLLTPLKGEAASAMAANDDALGAVLVQAIQDAGDQIVQNLVTLQNTDPALYAEAMGSLQGLIGNDGVNSLHEQVTTAGGPEEVVVDLAGGGKLSADDEETASGTIPLLEALTQGMEIPGEAVDVRVNEEAKEKTESAGAAGMVESGTTFLNPDAFDPGTSSGAELMAHEMTHISQGVEAAASAPGSPQPSRSASEGEASRMGSRFASGKSVSKATQRHPGGRARDTDAEAGTEASSSACPTKVALSLGGTTIEVQLPDNNTNSSVTVALSASPFPGLTLNSAKLTFDADWKLESGEVSGSISMGSYLSMDNVKLGVSSNGALSTQVNDAKLVVGDALEGTVNLQISGEGITGSGTFDHTGVTLREGLELQGGAVALSIDGMGSVQASGTLTGQVTGLGGFTLGVQVLNATISGSLSLDLTEPLDMGAGMSVLSGALTGTYSPEGFEIGGQARVNINNWAEADIEGRYHLGTRAWSLHGDISQSQDILLGELAVTGGALSIAMEAGTIESIQAKGHYTFGSFEGDIDGAYTSADNTVSGTATTQLNEPLPLGETGASLKKLDGTATVEANVLTSITGSGEAEILYAGEPTFQILGEGMVYDVPGAVLSGSATATTLRELTLGAADAVHGKIATGASATAAIADNSIGEVTGGMVFQVLDAAGELGTGSLDLAFPNGMDSMEGTASLTLSTDYGFPERETGPLILKTGGTLTGALAEGALKTLTLTGVGFQLRNPMGEGTLDGTAEGTWEADTSKLNASGSGQISTPWPFTTSWGNLSFTEGGTLTASIVDSELEQFTGNIPYTAEVTAGQGIAFSGAIDGTYSGESNAVTGTIDGTLDADVSLPMGTDSVNILADTSVTAQITDNTFETANLNLHGQYVREGTPLLEGTIPDAVYTSATGEVDFDGELTLIAPIEQQSPDGNWTLLVLENSSIQTTVTKNTLEKLGGDLLFQIHDTDGALFEGQLNSADLDPADWSLSGEVSVASLRPYSFPRTSEAEGIAPEFAFEVIQGSQITGRAEKSALTGITADLQFRVNHNGGELALGEINGDWDMTTDSFTGSGSVALTQDFMVGATEASGERLESWASYVTAGSSIDLSIAANTFEQATVDLGASLRKDEQEVATASLAGSYRLGDEEGFTGTAHFELTQPVMWHSGSRFDFDLALGTSMDAQMEKGAITGAQGALHMSAKEGEGEKAHLAMDNLNYTPGAPVSGMGTVEVSQDIDVYQGAGGTSLHLAPESGGNAEVANDDLQKLDGTLKLRLDKDASPLAQGDFTATYDATQGSDAMVSAEGTMAVLSEVDMTPSGSDYRFILLPTEGVTATLVNSELEKVNGALSVRVEDSAGEFVLATINGEYLHGAEPSFSGTGSIQVTRETPLGVDMAGYAFHLMPSTGGEITITNSVLDLITGTVAIQVSDAEGPMALVDLNGTYTHATEMFDGNGSASLTRQVVAAENVGGMGLNIFLEPATGLQMSIAQNTLDEVTGTLGASVHDEAGEFLLATADGTYTTADGGNLDASGSVEITRAKSMVQTGNGFEVFLDVGTGATISIVQSEMEGLSGAINSLVKYQGEDLVRVVLQGDYTEATGFDGTGKASLLSDLEVGTLGDYTLFLEGTETDATVTLAASEVTQIGGSVQVRLDDGTTPFIRGLLTGNYDFAGKIFTGSGSAEILAEKHLAELNGENLYLTPGSGATANIENNALTEVGGNIVLSMRDDSEYLIVTLEGSFDASSGKFNGSGGAAITREKLLFGEAGSAYSFWLKPGTGAKGTLVDNALTEVGGAVPFIVNDEVGPLIEGSAEGKYLTETGLFTGNGNVMLGRDIEFQLGTDTLVKFKKGSGGSGEIVDSELRKLGGTLNLELWTDGEALVSMSASGEYDAVENKLLWAEGSATLLKPWELLDGKIIVEGVTGTARIEDGELVRAGGEGTISIPDLKSVGTIAMDWRTEGGKDVYSGSGQLNFTLLDDPETGRKTEGEISIAYNEDNTFRAEGNVDYQINEMLGGELGIIVDGGPGVDFDPILSGSFTAQGELVKAADLFKLELPILPHLPIQVGGPFPIVLGVGAKGAMALAMLPLEFSATIGIDNFRPLAEDADVPNFEAILALNWGLNFEAQMMAYVSLNLGYGPVTAGAGVRGEAILNAPLSISPYGILRGGPDGFGGELGIGISLAPTFVLRIVPFVEARISELAATYDLPALEIDMGEIFSFEWGTKYLFGDVEGTEPETAQEQSVPAPAQTETTHTEEPKVPTTSGSVDSVPGGPQLESGSEIAGDKSSEGGGGGGMDELMAKVEDIKTIAEGLGSLAMLVELVINVIVTAAMFGPIGLLIYLVYEMVFGDLSWDGIKEAVNNVITAVEQGREMLEPFLPDWFQKIIDVFSGEKPGLLDAFLGADDAMRDAVHRGDHLHAPAEMRGKMCYEMLNGYTGEADQECILKVLEFSASKGDLRSVVNYAGGGTWIIDDLSGYEDTRAAELFDQHGVQYERGLFS